MFMEKYMFKIDFKKFSWINTYKPVEGSFLWQVIKHPKITTAIVVVPVLSLAILVGGYIYHWAWTGFNVADRSDKTLYDWLQLLMIPTTIIVETLWFSREQKNYKQMIAKNDQQEMALQVYMDDMSILLLDKKLRKSNPEDEVRLLGQAKTRAVLSRLDELRKPTVIQFLYDSGLIHKDNSIV